MCQGRSPQVGVLSQDFKAGRVGSTPSTWTAEWLESNSQLGFTGGGGKMHVPMTNDGRKFKGFVSSGS